MLKFAAEKTFYSRELKNFPRDWESKGSTKEREAFSKRQPTQMVVVGEKQLEPDQIVGALLFPFLSRYYGEPMARRRVDSLISRC